MKKLLKILLFLKDKKMSNSLASLMKEHEVDIFYDKSLFELMKKKTYHVIIFEDEIESVASIKQNDPRVEVICFGKSQNDEEAVKAIKHGASAYFSDPVDTTAFRNTIQSIYEQFNNRKETAELENLLNSKYRFASVLGRNPQMLDIFAFMRHIAPYYKVITINGETGTGKEIIAKTLHLLSPVREGPFVVCNCGGFVENLVESELFGHKRGAFTGAIYDKKGLFEIAENGTILLDEIGELPFSFQAHLLRVLQDGEFRPVGSNRSLKANCRIIAATNKDLGKEIQNGNFREDLFYRLTPLTIHLPPLRDRKDDIPLLQRSFLEEFIKRTGKHVYGISMPAQTKLMQYNWPGNVRELQSVVERAAMLTTESFIRIVDLPSQVMEPIITFFPGSISLDEVNKNHIRTVLEQCRGNRTHAAKILGLSRRALLRKLEKHSIQ